MDAIATAFMCCWPEAISGSPVLHTQEGMGALDNNDERSSDE